MTPVYLSIYLSIYLYLYLSFFLSKYSGAFEIMGFLRLWAEIAEVVVNRGWPEVGGQA